MFIEQEHGLYIAEWLRFSGSGMNALMNATLVKGRLRSGMRSFHDSLQMLYQRHDQRHRDAKALWELEFESAFLLRKISDGYENGSSFRPLCRSWFSTEDLIAAAGKEAIPMELSHSWFKSIYSHLVLSKPSKAFEGEKEVAKRTAVLDTTLERLKVFFPQAQCLQSSISDYPVDIGSFNHVQLLALSYVIQLSSGWIFADAVGDNGGRAFFGVQLEYGTRRAIKAMREGSDSLLSNVLPSYDSVREDDLPRYGTT